MKKIFSSILVISAVAAMFTACSRQENPVENNASVKHTVNFVSGNATKVYFEQGGDFTDGASLAAFWSGDEAFKVLLNLGYKTTTDATAIVDDDNDVAKFSAELEDDESGSYTFYAVSPASAALTNSRGLCYVKNTDSQKGIEVQIPATQKPTFTSPDPDAMVLIGYNDKPLTSFPEEGEEVEMQFHHCPVYFKMNFINIPSDVTSVESISVSGDAVVGKYYFLPPNEAPIAYKAGASVTVTPPTSLVDDSALNNIWVAVLPMEEGTKLTMSLKSSDDKEYATTYTTKGKTSSGDVVVFDVDFEKATTLSVEEVTVAEFLAAEESSTQKYQLTGKITSIDNTTYGNFTIEDETGSVYVYGLSKTELGYGTNADKTFSSLGLEVGDTVTLIGYRGSYNGKDEVMYSYYVSHVKGTSSSDDDDDDDEEVTEYTTTVTCTTGSNAYVDGVATVNGTSDVYTLKIGTSKNQGTATITLPKGTTSMTFYAVSWKEKAATLVITVDGKDYEFTPAANDGATGQSPYTITVTEDDKFTLTLPSALTADTEATVTTSGSNKRVILFGIQYQ